MMSTHRHGFLTLRTLGSLLEVGMIPVHFILRDSRLNLVGEVFIDRGQMSTASSPRSTALHPAAVVLQLRPPAERSVKAS